MKRRTLSGEPSSGAVQPQEAEAASARRARALRILAVSGRRVVESDGGWRLVPRGDRRARALMRLEGHEVERLKADGLIVPAASGGYILAPDNQIEARNPDAQPAAGPWIFDAAGIVASKRLGYGFAAMAIRAKSGEGPLTLRQATAGLRLIEDAEQAARDPYLTMNWDAAPADKTRRSSGAGGLLRTVRRSQLRIHRLKTALGEHAFALAWSACIQRLPIRVLERRYHLARRAGPVAIAEVLEKVAKVYDG